MLDCRSISLSLATGVRVFLEQVLLVTFYEDDLFSLFLKALTIRWIIYPLPSILCPIF
jgi:hypothetical protein